MKGLETKKEQVAEFFQRRGVHYQMQLLLEMLLPKQTDKIELELNVNGGRYVTTDKIVIGLFDYLLDCNLEEIYSSLRALLGHEVGHLVYGEFKGYQEVIDRIATHLCEKHDISKTMGASVGRTLANSLEDGRVEQWMATDFEGLLNDFRYLRCLWWENMTVENGTTPLTAWQQVILTLVTTGLYPKGYHEHEYAEVHAEVLKVKDLLPKALTVPTLKEFYEIVWEVFMTCEPFIAKQLKENPESQIQMDQFSEATQLPMSNVDNEDIREAFEATMDWLKNLEEDKDSESETEENTTLLIHLSTEEFETSSDEHQQSEEVHQDEQAQQDVAQLKERLEKQLKEELGLVDEYEKLQQEYDEALKKATKSDSHGLSSEELKTVFSRYAYSFHLEHFNPATNISINPEIALRGQRLQEELRGLLVTEVEQMEEFCKSGIVNPQYLWRTGLDDSHIFSRRTLYDEPSFAISLLIDGSGSMMHGTERHGEPSDCYRDALISAGIIEEGLRGLVPFNITIFSGDGIADEQIEHFEVKGFNDSPVNHSWAFYTEHSSPFVQNYDGYSIDIVGRELLNRDEVKKILIVLSDGEPYAPHYSESHDMNEHTAQVIEKLRDEGVTVIGIGFGGESHRESHREMYERFYGKNLVLCDPEQVTDYLLEVLRTVVS